MSSAKKLEEAKFFLELMDALDKRKRPLTHTADTAKEASFLFSAVLNSFYSTIAILRDEEGVDVSSFVKAHPEIYARAKDGGERAKTVHIHHTEAAFSGYIPNANFSFRKIPVLIEELNKPGHLEFVFGREHYMLIELRGKLEHVTEFCHEHFYKLSSFHAQVQQSLPPII